MQFCLLGSGFSLVICGFLDNRCKCILYSSHIYFFSDAAFAFMVLALFFFGAGASGINCAFLDVSPRFSSTINTLGNTAGAVAGLLGPIVVSALVTAIDGIWGWRLVFLLTAGMGVVSLIIWAIYQTSDIVHELNTPATLYNPLLNDEDEDGRVHDGRPSSHKL